MPRRDFPATQSPDLPAVQKWVERNPAAEAQLSENTEHGGGEVVLIISIPDHEEMVRARAEVPPLVRFPDRLRFRRANPSEQEVEWTLQWVLGLMRRQYDLKLPTKVSSVGPDSMTGLIMIALDRVDREYAAELEARGDGLAFVTPQPETDGVPLAHGRSMSLVPEEGLASRAHWV